MGPMININAAKRIEDQVNQTISQGATLVCGGKREDAYYEPTILDNVTKDMDIMKDMEVFGPVIPVLGFDNVEEAIEIAINLLMVFVVVSLPRIIQKEFKLQID